MAFQPEGRFIALHPRLCALRPVRAKKIGQLGNVTFFKTDEKIWMKKSVKSSFHPCNPWTFLGGGGGESILGRFKKILGLIAAADERA